MFSAGAVTLGIRKNDPHLPTREMGVDQLTKVDEMIKVLVKTYNSPVAFQDLSATQHEFKGVSYLGNSPMHYHTGSFNRPLEVGEGLFESFSIVLDAVIERMYLQRQAVLELDYPTYIPVWEVQPTLEMDVISKYRNINEVKTISKDNYLSETIFTVFIESQSYSDSLMDTLLDLEIEILNKYKSQPVSFRYVQFVSQEVCEKQLSETALVLYRA